MERTTGIARAAGAPRIIEDLKRLDAKKTTERDAKQIGMEEHWEEVIKASGKTHTLQRWDESEPLNTKVYKA